MMRNSHVFLVVMYLLFSTGSALSQEQLLTNSENTVQGIADTSNQEEMYAESDENLAMNTLGTLWSMTEQGGALRWPIYIVFAIGIFAILLKMIQLIFDSKYTKPFIKHHSDDEAALQSETRSGTLRNLLEYKIKTLSPGAIVGLTSRYPKSKIAQLLKALGELASRTQNAVAFQEEVNGFVRREKDRFNVWQNFIYLMSDTAGALGLLGTVWGMYTTFIGGSLQPEQILSGMGIALVTTLLGLIVSITLNILSTGVVKMFSNRLDLMEYAGDTFRGQFAEINLSPALTNQHQPAMQAQHQPAQMVTPTAPRLRMDAQMASTNIQMASKRIPVKLMVIAGDHQEGQVKSQLPQPVEVQVLDQDEAGLPKQKISFEANGSDCIFPNGSNRLIVATDSRGRAKANVILGERVGTQMIVAKLNGDDKLVQEIQLESQCGPPHVVQGLPESNHQTGLLKEKLPIDLGVKLQDKCGNPNQNFPVVFRIVTNDVVKNSGRFSNRKSTITVVTDEQGIASTPLWLGEEIGPNVVQAVTQIRNSSKPPEALFYATGKDS